MTKQELAYIARLIHGECQCLYINDCRDCHFVGVKGCFDKLVEWIKQEREGNDD